MKNMTTKKLTTCAVMLAFATVLSFVKYGLANGGSITLASMVPILVIAFLYDTKTSLLTSLAYGLIQMMVGFYAPPVKNFVSFAAVVLLDYVIAFGVLGLGGIIYRLMKEKGYAIPVSGIIVTAMRFVCHFLSGVLIWNVYAAEGQSAEMYSLLYNGSYMLPEMVITAAVLAIMAPFIQKQIKRNAQ